MTEKNLQPEANNGNVLVSGQLPHDLRRKIEIHIETTLECIENFGIPKYVKELLEQDIELYREILQKTK